MRVAAGRILAVLLAAFWLMLTTGGCSSGDSSEIDAGQDADAGEQTDRGPDGATRLLTTVGRRATGTSKLRIPRPEPWREP